MTRWSFLLFLNCCTAHSVLVYSVRLTGGFWHEPTILLSFLWLFVPEKTIVFGIIDVIHNHIMMLFKYVSILEDT